MNVILKGCGGVCLSSRGFFEGMILGFVAMTATILPTYLLMPVAGSKSPIGRSQVREKCEHKTPDHTPLPGHTWRAGRDLNPRPQAPEACALILTRLPAQQTKKQFTGISVDTPPFRFSLLNAVFREECGRVFAVVVV